MSVKDPKITENNESFFLLAHASVSVCCLELFFICWFSRCILPFQLPTVEVKRAFPSHGDKSPEDNCCAWRSSMLKLL